MAGRGEGKKMEEKARSKSGRKGKELGEGKGREEEEVAR